MLLKLYIVQLHIGEESGFWEQRKYTSSNFQVLHMSYLSIY